MFLILKLIFLQLICAFDVNFSKLKFKVHSQLMCLLKVKTKHSLPVISIFYPSSGRDSIIFHNPSFTNENF